MRHLPPSFDCHETVDADNLPVPIPEEIRLAEERLAEYRANPDAVVTLEEIKARFSDCR